MSSEWPEIQVGLEDLAYWVQKSVHPGFVPDHCIGHIKRLLDALTDMQRHDLFCFYCTHCGSKDSRCQCWNDE